MGHPLPECSDAACPRRGDEGKSFSPHPPDAGKQRRYIQVRDDPYRKNKEKSMSSHDYPFYLGSYAPATQPGIYAFTLDGNSGQLTPGWTFTGIVHPSFVALHPNKRWLFAVSETSAHQEGRSGEVWALHLPAAGTTEQPRQINHQPSNGDWPCHLSIDASGRWLLASNYQSGNVSVFPIQEDGALGTLAANVQHHGHGPNPDRQAGPHTHSTIFTPDQRFVVVADLGIDQL